MPSAQGSSPHAVPGRRLSRAASATAETAAVLRAAGALVADQDVRGPDVMAARLLPWTPHGSTLIKVPGIRRLVVRSLIRRRPGAVWFEVVRTRYMDDVVCEEVHAGATQVVILGAGLDSRAYRMTDTLASTTVFEVDHPRTSAFKRERLAATLGRALPGHVRFVTVDFNRDGLAEALERERYDPAARSVVVWSGVAPYLQPAGVEATLNWMSDQAAGSCIVFDYPWQEVIDGTATEPGSLAVARWVAAKGEPWLWGIPKGHAASYLSHHGLHLDDHLDLVAAQRRYLSRSDKTVAGPIWQFGAFACARVPHRS